MVHTYYKVQRFHYHLLQHEHSSNSNTNINELNNDMLQTKPSMPNNGPTYWTELPLPHSNPPLTAAVAVAAEKEAHASYGMGTGSMDYCIVAPLHRWCRPPTCPCYHFQGHTLDQRCVPVDMWCIVDGDRWEEDRPIEWTHSYLGSLNPENTSTNKYFYKPNANLKNKS
jgi:hypothetical protein